MECEECSEECEVRSGASHVTCETGHHFRRMYARTGLAGVRHMQVLYMRKVLYIPKATSAPPRAGTTGNYDMIRDNYHYVFIIMMIILFFLPLPLTPSGLCGPQYGEKKWEHLPSLLCKRVLHTEALRRHNL